MNSLGGNISELTHPQTVEKPHYGRNITSSVKRQYKPRRKLSINPIRVEQELEEIENEPLPEIRYTPDDLEDSNKLKETSIENIKSNETVETCKGGNSDVDKADAMHDSFDVAFSFLSLETPVKSSRHASEQNFHVQNNDTKPSVDQNSHFSTADMRQNAQNFGIQKPDYRFVTPRNKIPPKIQCSVDVRPYLKTPIHQLGSQYNKAMSVQKLPLNTPKQIRDTCEKKNEKALVSRGKENVQNKVQFTLPRCSLLDEDLTFKKIVVNKVEYIILKLLGRGGSSQVFHCYDLETKNNRAIKCVSLTSPDSAQGYINEVKLLHKLQHCDRIIKMYDYEIRESEKSLLVVLEMGGADLSKILKELALNTTHLPMYMLVFYWMEMLYAVKQIHSNGIIHSDLKPANFLKAESGLKLIDFGIASCIQSDMTSVLKSVTEGSFNYISPEALKNDETCNVNSPLNSRPKHKISYKSDVWSLGCILYQLVYRKTPFQHITNVLTKFATIVNPEHEIQYPEAKWVPERIICTIKKCLQYEMKSRPFVDELIEEYENIFSEL